MYYILYPYNEVSKRKENYKEEKQHLQHFSQTSPWRWTHQFTLCCSTLTVLAGPGEQGQAQIRALEEEHRQWENLASPGSWRRPAEEVTFELKTNEEEFHRH